MFTGIIEELGLVRETGDRLQVACQKVVRDSGQGDSIAVNGVCLTVVERTMDQSEAGADGTLAFDLSPETLSRTSLGRLSKGDAVNLERPVTLTARLGGHLVQGHVEGVGEITEMVDAGSGTEMWISLPRDMARYVVEKCSIAVDGVSLTVAGLHDGAFGVALIPHTLDVTTLGSARRGDPVNLEVDVIAKYVEGLLGISANQKERSA